MANAMMSPITGQSVHWPPNQCNTAVYQSSVVGRKMKPRMGYNREFCGKIPLNHVEKNQSSRITSRGAASAKSAKRHGIVGGWWRVFLFWIGWSRAGSGGQMGDPWLRSGVTRKRIMPTLRRSVPLVAMAAVPLIASRSAPPAYEVYAV